MTSRLLKAAERSRSGGNHVVSPHALLLALYPLAAGANPGELESICGGLGYEGSLAELGRELRMRHEFARCRRELGSGDELRLAESVDLEHPEARELAPAFLSLLQAAPWVSRLEYERSALPPALQGSWLGPQGLFVVAALDLRSPWAGLRATRTERTFAGSLPVPFFDLEVDAERLLDFGKVAGPVLSAREFPLSVGPHWLVARFWPANDETKQSIRDACGLAEGDAAPSLRISLPVFSISTTATVEDSLAELGFGGWGEPAARSLSCAVEPGSVDLLGGHPAAALRRLQHRLAVRFDEHGLNVTQSAHEPERELGVGVTRAVGPKEVPGEHTSPHAPPLLLDRAFQFVVEERRTGTIYYAGRVTSLANVR